MIPEELILKAREISKVGPTKYQTPSQQLVDITTNKALLLANQLNANNQIVEVGCLLMDSELGLATKEERPAEHIEMAVINAKELLRKYVEISDKDKNNILACITEHHGAKNFTSIESEICCNADCYKFTSVEGFISALRFMRPMPLDKQLKILEDKLEEKWNALTLDICVAELKPQYEAIGVLLGHLESNNNKLI